MFRESVLIALTILITVLALSFVILMTVFIQIRETEQMMQRIEKDRNTTDDKALQVGSEPEGDNDGHGWQDIERANREREEEFERQRKAALPTTTTTTEEPTTPWYGFRDSKYPMPPDAVIFPYHFFGGSGHLTLEFPLNMKAYPSIDFEADKLLIEVTKRLYEYYSRKIEEEMESRKMYYGNGERNYPIEYFFPFNGKHDSYIWFDKEVLQRFVPLSTTTTTTTTPTSTPSTTLASTTPLFISSTNGVPSGARIHHPQSPSSIPMVSLTPTESDSSNMTSKDKPTASTTSVNKVRKRRSASPVAVVVPRFRKRILKTEANYLTK